MTSQRSTTPRPMGLLPIVVVVIVAVFHTQPTEGQYYCNGRAAVTMQWGGCNGTEAVCSYLMQAITQTYNWWNTTNNTAGNSVGVAVHNFFTTDAYSQLLSFTNNNTAYPSVCTKIAKIVAQLLIWNSSKDANVILGNATYAATVRQELFGTVIPNWGYTIGQYIACGSTCTNYSSTTSTTTTHSTTTAASTTTTTSPPAPTTSTTATTTHSTTTTAAPTTSTTATTTHSTTTTAAPTTSTTATTTHSTTTTAASTTTSTKTITSTTNGSPAVPPTNCSSIIFGNGYYPGNNITSSIDYDNGYDAGDFPIAGSACSTPYSERLYFPGMNTPQSSYWRTRDVLLPFVPNQQGAFSLYYGCVGNVYNTVPQSVACLCSPNGSCYYLNGTGGSFDLEFYSWCYNGDCVTYMGYCYDIGDFYDVATSEKVTDCTAINAGGPLEDCYPGSTNCSYLPVAYFACGPCPSATMEPPICPGPIDLVCKGAPSLYGCVYPASIGIPLVMAQPASGENFPNITGLTLLGTCNNCSSPNTTQYFYPEGSSGQFTCMNGTNPAQVDWTGLCMCDQFGGCFQFRSLPDGSATINSVVSMTVYCNENVGLEITITCLSTNANVVVEDEKGNAVFACDGALTTFEWYIFSLRCSGRCPTNQPLEIYCPGPYVAA